MSRRETDREQEELGPLREWIEAVQCEAPADSDYQTARRKLMEKLETTQKESWIMSIIRKAGYAKLRLATACGIAVLAVVLAVVFNPLGQGPRDVFAEAVGRLHNARTLTCTCVDDYNPGPIEMAYKEPGRFRLALRMGFWPAVIVVNHETRKGIMLYPEAKMYDELTNSFSPKPEVANLIDDLRSLPMRADKELGKREINGRTALGFLVSRGDAAGELKNVEVWVDAKTGDTLLLQGEQEANEPVIGPDGSTVGPIGTTLMKTRTVHRIMSNFKFNVDLDDSLFDANPPEGWSVGPRTMSRVDRPSAEKTK